MPLTTSQYVTIRLGFYSLLMLAIAGSLLISMDVDGEEVTERSGEVELDQTVSSSNSDNLSPDNLRVILVDAIRLTKSFEPPNSWQFKLYDTVHTRFAPVVPEESMFFDITESDSLISCDLDIFEVSNAGFYPLAADGNLKRTGGGGVGGEIPEMHWAARVNKHPRVTLNIDPPVLLAATDYSGIPASYSTSEITMQIDAIENYGSPGLLVAGICSGPVVG